MKLDISFQEYDNQALVSFVKVNEKRTFVVQRKLRNLNGKIPLRSREDVGSQWQCAFLQHNNDLDH